MTDRVQASSAFETAAGSPGISSRISSNIRYTDNASGGLRVKGLTLTLPTGATLFEDMNIDLAPGDFALIRWPSGKGKTSLIRAIRALQKTGEGEIHTPPSSETFCIPQRPDIPPLSLRGILSKPRDEHAFSNDDIADALKAVGYASLIQHLPGRTVDSLIPVLKTLAHEDALRLAPALVAERTDILQSVTDGQRAMLGTLLADRIDASLAAPLIAKLVAVADATVGGPVAITSREARLIANATADRFVARLNTHVAEFSLTHTDGLARLILRMLPDLSSTPPARPSRAFAVPNDFQLSLMRFAIADAIVRNLAPSLETDRQNLFNNLSNNVANPLRPRAVRQSIDALSETIARTAVAELKQEQRDGVTLFAKASGGQRQRIAIAAAILNRPRLLIMDEATSGLDPASAICIYRMLREKLPGTTVLTVGHDPGLVPMHDVVIELAGKSVRTVPVREVSPSGGPDFRIP